MIPLTITRKTGNKVQPPEQFARSPLTFGSGPGCDIRFDPVWDRGVATLHGRLEWRRDGWVIIDAGSTAGTWVNGGRISKPEPLLRAVDIELGKGGASLRVEPAQASSGASAMPRAALVLGAILLLIGVGWWIGLKPQNPPTPSGPNQASQKPPEIARGASGSPGIASPSPTPEGPPRRFAMGMKEPTAAERAYLASAVPTAKSISLNALAMERGAKALNREAEAPALKPASFGNELHSVLPGKAAHDFTVKGTESEVELPHAVDNSKLPCFPPVGDQNQLGSCACFSMTYYAASHNTGLVHKWSRSSDPARDFSPKWTYAMVNGGQDEGSSFLPTMNFLERHGAPTLAEWPYVGEKDPPANYRQWGTSPEIWRSALQHRFKETGTIGHLDTPEGLSLLKTFLADGYIGNFSTYINHWSYARSQANPATPGGVGANQDVCYYVPARKEGEDSDGHALTVVGYDDNLWVDVNKNGVVDPGETGAFKIANSWGTSGWNEGGRRDGALVGQGGFVWILYDALKHHSEIPGFTPADRSSDQGGFHSDSVYYLLPYPHDYQPKMVAQFTVEGDQRQEIDVRFGIAAAEDAKKPDAVWRPGALTVPQWDEKAASIEEYTGMGGPFGMNGELGRSSGTCVFDLTDLLMSVPPNVRTVQIFLMVNKLSPTASVAVNEFTVLDAQGKTLATATGLPANIDAGLKIFSVQATLSVEQK